MMPELSLEKAKTNRLRCQKEFEAAEAAFQRAQAAVAQAEDQHATALQHHELARADATQKLTDSIRSGMNTNASVSTTATQKACQDALEAVESAQRAKEVLRGERDAAVSRLEQAIDQVRQAACKNLSIEAAEIEQQLRDSAALTTKLYQQLKAYTAIESRPGMRQMLSPSGYQLLQKMDVREGITNPSALGNEPWIAMSSKLFGEFQQLLE